MLLDYLLCYGSESNTPKCLRYAKLVIVFTTRLSIFSLFWSHTWKYKIQANEILTKIKEKWSTINFDISDLSFHFLHFNVPDNTCHKQKWRMLCFTYIKLKVHVLVWAPGIAHIKWVKLLDMFSSILFCLHMLKIWKILNKLMGLHSFTRFWNKASVVIFIQYPMLVENAIIRYCR